MHCNKVGKIRQAADLPEGDNLQSRRVGATPLVHGDPRAGCTIQQPLEVEAGKLIISALTNMPGECRNCAGVACFQFGKCLQITLCRGIFVLVDPKGLEGAQGLRPAPQQKVPHRTTAEVLYL